MVNIFKHRVFSRDENIIDCTQVLSIFGKTNASGMRNNRDTKSKKSQRIPKSIKLSCHQKDSEYFVDSTETASINLRIVYCLCLEKLFPHHSVLTLFTSRNTNTVRLKFSTDSCMAEDIVGGCRFLDKPRFIWCE